MEISVTKLLFDAHSCSNTWEGDNTCDNHIIVQGTVTGGVAPYKIKIVTRAANGTWEFGYTFNDWVDKEQEYSYDTASVGTVINVTITATDAKGNTATLTTSAKTVCSQSRCY